MEHVLSGSTQTLQVAEIEDAVMLAHRIVAIAQEFHDFKHTSMGLALSDRV